VLRRKAIQAEATNPIRLMTGGGGDRTQRRASEESHFDVVHEGMDAEEPLRQFLDIRRF
jgi:hypothetical protein